ncbi:MAG: adenine phosphoribosyltransferase [Mycoplasmatales bacterium]
MKLKDYILEVEDFPKKGISFKDITPLIKDAQAFKYTVNEIANFAVKQQASVIVGPDARGFIIGCPVAYASNLGFVPVRKSNKLPRETIQKSYELEYGENTLMIHKHDIQKGDKVLITDDLLATGGTIKAVIELVEALGAEVVGIAFILEIKDLQGQKAIETLGTYNIKVLESY